ncbi:MAG: class I SAM-dependent methyltransferase [Halioglobus sp.]
MLRPIANISFAMMRRYVRSIQGAGVPMMHTARSFSYYRKIFYNNESKNAVIESLRGKRIVDIGCGYTPYAADSMFRACHDAEVEFYGVDPVINRDIEFGIKERAMAKATGGSGSFSAHAPGLSKALSTSAEQLDFEDESVDEILCSYLLFVWIEDEALLIDILSEFLRVLKPGGKVKLYPLPEWRFMRLRSPELRRIVSHFKIEQSFVHGHGDFRVTPSMLTLLSKC